jgi:hypothetical protein
MVGALGEILGAAGVIVTLGYLAAQIRSNTRATRRAAMQELLDQTGHFMDQISSTPEGSATFRAGLIGADSLSAEQQMQFQVRLYRMVLLWERLFHVAGELEPWIIEHNRRTRRDIVTSPGFKAWFAEAPSASWFSGEFRRVLEQEMSMGGSPYPPAKLP